MLRRWRQAQRRTARAALGSSTRRVGGVSPLRSGSGAVATDHLGLVGQLGARQDQEARRAQELVGPAGDDPGRTVGPVITVDVSYLPNGAPTNLSNQDFLANPGVNEVVVRAQFQLVL